MSDIKMNGGGQPAKLALAASSPQKTQSNTANEANPNAKPQAGAIDNSKQIAERNEASQEQVEKAVTKLNDYVQSVQRDLQFNLDDSSGKTIITVVDKKTSEVVRQIPDDVALKLAQDLQQSEPLSLFNAKV